MSAENIFVRAERIAQWFHANKPSEVEPSGNPTQFDALRFAWGYLFQREKVNRNDLADGPAMRGYDYAASHPDEEV